MTLKSDANFKEKLTLGSKNDMGNLVNFNVNSSRSENLHFDVLLLSIEYRVSAKKVQKNYLSWRCKNVQTLKKNWLLVSKMAWRIWWTLLRAAKSLKYLHLVGYFCRKYVVFELIKIQRSCVVKNDIRNK